MSLTDRDRAVLDFETEIPVWRYQGHKDTEVRQRFGLSLTRYAQVVNALLDNAEAEVYAPATVRRLRRLRTARASGRGRPVRL